MKVLLDTHIIMWALSNDERLPREAEKIISRKENEIYYSTASVWEITIKHLKHPEHMPVSGKELSGYCRQAGYQELPVRDEYVYMLESLRRRVDAPRHKDPFDCLLIAQAKAEGMIFVTHDSLIPYYMESCIMSV